MMWFRRVLFDQYYKEAHTLGMYFSQWRWCEPKNDEFIHYKIHGSVLCMSQDTEDRYGLLTERRVLCFTATSVPSMVKWRRSIPWKREDSGCLRVLLGKGINVWAAWREAHKLLVVHQQVRTINPWASTELKKEKPTSEKSPQ